jgi:hypothetical protein
MWDYQRDVLFKQNTVQIALLAAVMLGSGIPIGPENRFLKSSTWCCQSRQPAVLKTSAAAGVIGA